MGNLKAFITMCCSSSIVSWPTRLTSGTKKHRQKYQTKTSPDSQKELLPLSSSDRLIRNCSFALVRQRNATPKLGPNVLLICRDCKASHYPREAWKDNGQHEKHTLVVCMAWTAAPALLPWIWFREVLGQLSWLPWTNYYTLSLLQTDLHNA